MTRPRFAAFFAAVLAAVVSLTSHAQDAPFIGVVTQDSVEVRSGAGRAYYVVGELTKGDMVRVEKVLFNQTWYQVRVPKGVHSYVSKVFVDAQGDGATGTVNADRTEFKAASLRGPGESYKGQGTFSKGDKVTILAEEGNFYKIVSPEDAFVFIPAGTLREATKDDLEAAEEADPDKGDSGNNDNGEDTPDPEPVKPVDPVTPDPEPVTPDPEPATPVDPEPVTPVDPVTPDPEPVTPAPEPVTPDPEPVAPIKDWPEPPKVEVETPARSAELKALEMKVLPYFSLPVEEQPLDKMAGAYQELAGTEGLPNIDQQIIKVRLRTIERRQQILDTLRRAETAEQTDHARTVVPDAPDADDAPEQFTAVGRLMPSTVYDGQSLPLLYRVVDASPSARTLAYVAPNDEVNIAAMLNRLVGVVGETTYNRTLKLQVIEIEKAVLLEVEVEEEADAAEDAVEGEVEEAVKEDNSE